VTNDDLIAAARWLIRNHWQLERMDDGNEELREAGSYGDVDPVCRFEVPPEHREAVDAIVGFRVPDYYSEAGPWRPQSAAARIAYGNIQISGTRPR
jgi:hypothetical protein